MCSGANLAKPLAQVEMHSDPIAEKHPLRLARLCDPCWLE